MKRYMTTTICLALVFLFYPVIDSYAINTEFRGRVQSTYVYRDTDGFSRGFMDNMRGVQLRNELKFDLYLTPSEEYLSSNSYRLEKIFLSYRGAYDAIFELTDRYDDIRIKSPADHEYGKDDIQWENDLREAFIDLVAEEGNQLVTLRLGRQIVQWGDADQFNLINILNPSDYSFNMFYSPPEDTAIPLWMGRLNYELHDTGPFTAIGLEFVAIPDIRPTQFAPLGGTDGFANFDAPYAYLFKDMADPMGDFTGGALPVPTRRVREDVAADTWENMEYGIKLSMELLDFAGALHYVTHFQDDPAADFTEYWQYAIFSTPGTNPDIYFRHPRQRTIGLSFNQYIAYGDFIVRGEASQTKDMWLTDATGMVAPVPLSDLSMINKFKVTKALIGIDKDIKYRGPLGSDVNWIMSFQAYTMHVHDLPESTAANPQYLDGDNWRFTLGLMNIKGYLNGALSYIFNFAYEPEGVWNIRPQIDYYPDHHWFFSFVAMAFMGNRSATSTFTANIPVSEVSLRAGYMF